ncbi:hypothetical protein Tco_0530103 [Tanacetum coccineum]
MGLNAPHLAMYYEYDALLEGGAFSDDDKSQSVVLTLKDSMDPGDAMQSLPRALKVLFKRLLVLQVTH